MTIAIERLVTKAQLKFGKSNFPVNKAADFFARTGEWVTIHFLDLANDWMCSDINSEYAVELSKNVPNAEIKIGDSYKLVEELGRYDLILADCPLGTYGEDNRYCEHFQFLEIAINHLNDTGFLFFNVNCCPYVDKEHGNSRKDNYGMDTHKVWFEKREKFYGVDASKLEVDFVQKFYSKYFEQNGFKMVDMLTEFEPSNLANHSDFVLRCLVKLEKDC